MNMLLLYFLIYTFFRSISNGLDRLSGASFSMILSLTVIGIGVVAAWHARHVRIHKRLFVLLIAMSVFVAACILSFVTNGFGAGKIVNQYAALYEMFRYVHLIMFVTLLAAFYRHPDFCPRLHRVYMWLLFVISAVGLGQYLTGHAELVTQYDKFERVAGLSSHPVPYSLEIVLTFFVCELSRRKMRLPIQHVHLAVYLLFVVALVLSASRTGVALLGVALSVYLFIQRPGLLPAFAAAFAILLWLSPFGELFSDLKTVPDYIMNGEYVVWDWQTAVTSVHWRIHHWYYLSTLGLERAWIGYGPGQTPIYSPFLLQAHNQFVEIFFDTGMVGLISFAAFWFSLPLAAMSDRRRIINTFGKKSAEAGILHFWVAIFVGVTLVALLDQSFNRETVAFSHLIVTVFIVLSQPEAVTARNPGWSFRQLLMTAGSPAGAAFGERNLAVAEERRST
ncbi:MULTISPECIES: O-antigen ligase family protein [Bradyrhizobium]|uniref:O-antigen ligase family protein n=1 Tax=Bradyrhizobium brasilense TaxID=1419277 RepID=UPI0028780355|nr:O-antigen ligase family protein [Bradyrhizobium brasilense]MCP3416916.1 O-antigen ligase family protein [Bradyrhizobium brasilense]